MAYAAILLLSFSYVGCRATAIKVPYALPIVIAVIVTMAAVQALPAYWHSKGKTNLRDASLTIPWAFLFWAVLPYPIDIGARLGRHIRLKDLDLARIDNWLGVSVPGLVHWSSIHGAGAMVNRTYPALAPFIAVAFLLPSLTGKVKAARQFLRANLVAFIVGVPLFAIIPAVGPWTTFHLPVSPLQSQCQSDLVELRTVALYVHHVNGVVCFPSFHVMWAILCAQSFWGFRILRLPACILSGMIVFSTMTTGWHYFTDVVGGILLASFAMVASELLERLGSDARPRDGSAV